MQNIQRWITSFFLLQKLSADNIEKYIKKCINSILAQSSEDYEVIIVDDGSYDTTPNLKDSNDINVILDKYEQDLKNHSNVKMLIRK